MSIYIDGAEKASTQASGNIRNFPYPVNIGRNAETHGQETSVYICDAQMDEVGIFAKALTSSFHPEEAALWLDFEQETEMVHSTVTVSVHVRTAASGPTVAYSPKCGK